MNPLFGAWLVAAFGWLLASLLQAECGRKFLAGVNGATAFACLIAALSQLP